MSGKTSTAKPSPAEVFALVGNLICRSSASNQTDKETSRQTLLTPAILRVAVSHGFKNMTATHTEKNATVADEITRRKFIVSATAANRIDRLAAQLGMERGELVESLLDRAIREVDDGIATGDRLDDVLEPVQRADFDSTTPLDQMTVAGILAADAKGPGTIQRQRYFRQCIKEGRMPEGDCFEGEKLPPAMAKRRRKFERDLQRAGILLALR